VVHHYFRRDDVISQLSMDLIGYDNVQQAVEDPEFELDSSKTTMMLSDHGRMFELNLISALVWELLSEVDGTDTIAGFIAAHYDADEAQVRTDVEKVLEDFLAFGLTMPGD
jgi:hypothetical protein